MRPDPRAVGGSEPLVDLLEQPRAQRPESAFTGQVAEGTGALGDEDIGRRPVALGVYEQRQLGRVCVSSLDFDPGRLGEGLQQRLDQLLAATRVDGDRIGGPVR